MLLELVVWLVATSLRGATAVPSSSDAKLLSRSRKSLNKLSDELLAMHAPTIAVERDIFISAPVLRLEHSPMDDERRPE